MLHEIITITGDPDHVLVKDVPAVGPDLGRRQWETQIGLMQQLGIALRFLRPLFGPTIQTRKHPITPIEPARRPLSVAPIACAASSTIGMPRRSPSSSNGSIGAHCP